MTNIIVFIKKNREYATSFFPVNKQCNLLYSDFLVGLQYIFLILIENDLYHKLF